MSEVELLLLDQTESCTVYTIQFLSDDLNEFEKFVTKFQADGELNKDFRIIAKFIDQILDFGEWSLILGNGGQKKTRTYDEDDTLKGYVLTLQRFEQLLKEGVANGSVIITENEIETDKTFEI